MFALHAQPLKTLCLLYRATAFLVKLPAWIVLSAIPQTRQTRTWTFSRALHVRILKDIVDLMFTVKTFPNPPFNPGKVGLADWIWVDPTPELVVGEIREFAARNQVECVRVRGCMQSKNEEQKAGSRRADPGERIVYHLHGGGYIMCDASPSGPGGYVCRQWLNESQDLPRAFLIDYRLCQGPPLVPGNPFPAQLVDALAGYNYLVNTLGFEPKNIIIGGESAGAHLAIVLTRYLIINALPGLAPPGGLMLASPVSDWGGSHVGKEYWVRNDSTDVCQGFFLGYPTGALLGSLPEEYARKNMWFSPGSLDIESTRGWFKDFPPVLIIAGAVECLLDQIWTLKERMLEDMGEEKLTYLEVPDALHGFITMGWHELERSQTMRDIVEWASRVSSVWNRNA